MRRRPSSGVSKPARRRRSVVLPQPEGPGRVRNSPGRTSSETRSRATTSPYVFRTDSIETAPRMPGTRAIVDDGAPARAPAASGLARLQVEALLPLAGGLALVVHALDDRSN